MQTGITNGSGSYGTSTITFAQPFRDTNYVVNLTALVPSSTNTSETSATHRGITRFAGALNSKSNTGMTIQSYANTEWRAEGYIR